MGRRGSNSPLCVRSGSKRLRESAIAKRASCDPELAELVSLISDLGDVAAAMRVLRVSLT
jgi:hypothetical protein